MGKPRLTQEQIDGIRSDYLDGQVRLRDIAEKYNVAMSTVSRLTEDLERASKLSAKAAELAAERLARTRAIQALKNDASRIRSNNRRLEKQIVEMRIERDLWKDRALTYARIAGVDTSQWT